MPLKDLLNAIGRPTGPTPDELVTTYAKSLKSLLGEDGFEPKLAELLSDNG